jgi:hypothetical protein
VTRADWKRARGRRGDRFPAEQQLLADDLIRCKQLKGKRSAAVRALLGAPDTRQRRYMDWSLGSERGSMFQIDSEYLTVMFDRRGVVRSVTIDQG